MKYIRHLSWYGFTILSMTKVIFFNIERETRHNIRL